MKIKQFRYYADNDPRNFPLDLTALRLGQINLFNDYENISHIGIQGAPDTIVYIGGQEVLIGETGIYELNVPMKAITIRFSGAQLSHPEFRPLFIDFTYED